jgi:hypothetical protein
MKRSFILLIGLLSVSFSACGRETAAPPTTQGATAAISAPQPAPQDQQDQVADAGSGPAPTQDATALANPPVSSAAITAAAASGPEAADDSDDAPIGSTSLEKIADLPAQHQLPDGKWKPGVNYDPVVPSQPTSVAAGKVEVLEVFWYACPHCYAL